MNLRGILLGLAVLLLVVSGLFFLRAWLIAQTPGTPAPAPVAVAPAPAPLTKILVANVDIPTGTFMRDEMVRWQAWPTDAVDPSYLVEGKSDPKTVTGTGAVVRHPVAAGQPITEGILARPGDRGFLAAVLKPGMRAISIAVNEVSGLAGLIYPGDRVDVLLVHTVGEVQAPPAGAPPSATGAATGGQHRVSETILSNVRILAMDQNLSHPAGQPAQVARTLTIEVTPKQAEMLTVAVQLGQLTLSLRGLANAPDSPEAITNFMEIPEPDRGTTFTVDSDVSRATAMAPPPRPAPVYRAVAVPQTIEVNRGGKVEQLSVN
jgi:pilus assembly protein CpaB